MTCSDALQNWHDFYGVAATAAATLVGLLFVGLSIHIRIVVSHPDVRSLARVTLTSFFAILLVAIAMLVPPIRTEDTGYWLLIVGLVSLALTIRPAIQGLEHRHHFAPIVLCVRFGISALGFLAIAATGAIFINGDFQDGLHALLPIAVLLLVIAVRNTWDLLVTVAEKTQPA